MKRIIHEVQQGTDAWHALRAGHDTASEAPIAAGVSKHTARGELLKQKATGIIPEINARTQELFNKGHAAEAAARPLAEELTGELYPVTVSAEIDGLKLLASLDGATMMEDIIWENKLWNEALAADIRSDDLAAHYTVQMDQQLLVSGAKRCLFMTSDGTPERTVWCWYESTPEKAAALIAMWKQFRADLAAYTPSVAEAPAPIGKAPETLPALHIEVRGQVTASNLADFKATALAAIRGVNRDLQTDEHFADAAKAVTWCSDVETRLEAAKQHALSQTASIEALFRTMDEISVEARTVRLELEKLVKARKESLKGEIVASGIAAFRAHVEATNKRLATALLPPITVDFAGVTKGLRSFKSMRDAVDTELARGKIAANEIADRITANLKTLDEAGHVTLFPDRHSLVLKASDDLQAVIASRIAKHQADEAARLEAERARIRAEEQARADREAAAKVEADRREAQQIEAKRIQAENDKAAAERSSLIEANALALKAKLEDPAIRAQFAATHGISASQANPHEAREGVLNDSFRLLPSDAGAMLRAPRADEPATLKLGAINDRLGHLTVTAQNLADLGITHSATDKNARLFKESDWPRICVALANHIRKVCDEHAGAAA